VFGFELFNVLTTVKYHYTK